MQFLAFKQKLKDFPVFKLQDIRKLEQNFDLRRLNEWQKKGYITMIRRGYYVFPNGEMNELALFLVSNRIYSPSYISLEMALSYYHLIPEAVYGITAVTSQKTNTFKTPLGTFLYRHIQPALMFGYKLVPYQHQNISIAEMEKSLLDYLYFHPEMKNTNAFDELRLNIEILTDTLERKKMMLYLKEFHNASLEKRVKHFLTYLEYA